METNFNLPYSGKEKMVMRVSIKKKQIRLQDQVGNVSMPLTEEQYKFIEECNSGAGFDYLRTHAYVTFTNHGKRLFPFSFEGNKIVLIYQKGRYGRVLSLGRFPEDSEAYLLKHEFCNEKTLPHCFMICEQPVRIVIPLFQPNPLANGKANYWSIPLNSVEKF